MALPIEWARLYVGMITLTFGFFAIVIPYLPLQYKKPMIEGANTLYDFLILNPDF